MNMEIENVIYFSDEIIGIEIPVFAYDIELTGYIYPVLRYKHQVAGHSERVFSKYLDMWQSYTMIGSTPLNAEQIEEVKDFEQTIKTVCKDDYRFCIIQKDKKI